MEFVAIVLKVLDVANKLQSSFKETQLEMENLGLLLRINITASDLTTGKLFLVLESLEESAGIDYYSLSMADLENIFRKLIGDIGAKSPNDCSFLCKNELKNVYESVLSVQSDRNNTEN